MEFLISSFFGFWRRVDGSSKSPKFWHLTPMLMMILIYHMYGFNVLGAFVVAWVAMLDGFKDWTDFGYMSMRFTGYTALSVALFDLSVYYILCGLMCGLLYPIGHKLNIRRYTEIAEILTGFILTYGIFLSRGV